jgi:sec-independent protein translocase protein TatA
MDIGPVELLIVLFIVVLIFGPGRLVQLGRELGRGLHEFRKGIEDKKEDTDDDQGDRPVSS